MRNFDIHHNAIAEGNALIHEPIAEGFHWISCTRREFEVHLNDIQAMLDRLYRVQLLDLHITDILNNQLPSHYDYTSDYDIIIFRRLARGRTESDISSPGQILHAASAKGGPPHSEKNRYQPDQFFDL